ncbi:uncharacterized protein EDB91DRAFT_435371 [Suillus paluster]|uniref:uncharacterized protein n=1 Tax=Suillus paluster TaxID=48578 RepID=UPI001B861245|nr:uncharacterized protein EDB91DRAFT_435371 [Suillus paluster]KAG1754074.1 hypothetical protein EDB91DRAFT_435371 [Suillus paluster]
MSEHETYLAVLKAFYDYEPQSEDELAITENQIVFLLERTDDDWWKVKIKGDSQEEDSPSGFVPAAYVQQAQHTSLVRALYGFDSTAPGELSIEENEILMVFDREEGWMLVQSKKEGGKAGFVPGNYVEEVFTSCEEAEEVTQEGGQDELTVQEGERLWIIEKEGEEWWKCRNVHDIEGVVPASYLESNGAERGERQEAAKRARQKAERGQSSST